MSADSKQGNEQLSYGNTETQLYQTLIRRGQERSNRQLPETLEQYLVRLLLVSARVSEDQRQAPDERLAMRFLRALEAQTIVARGMALHELGAEGLKLLGFFPQQARRRNVTLQYMFNLTQRAYGDLAQLDLSRAKSSGLLQTVVSISSDIAEHLDELVQVLWSTRDAHELVLPSWHEPDTTVLM